MMIQIISTKEKKGKKAAWIKKALASAALMAALAVGLPTVPAHASTTFTVNIPGDTKDASLADNLCDVNPFAAGKQCTLRAAIEQANATAGADTIGFNIPDDFGSGLKTINVGATGNGALPIITEQVAIDGYTQPGASPNTKAVGNNAALQIELDGTKASSSKGLEIQDSSGSVIRGLVINRFATGIKIQGDSVANRIEGNFIGTNPKGTLDRGNAFEAVAIFDGPSQSVVGGTTPDKRNLISGNGGDGIFLGNSNQNRIEGNYVGTDKSGTKDLGNSRPGVFLNNASGNTIGGTTVASRNVISGNDDDGVRFVGDSTLNEVLGNRIGATASGTGALGNTLAGVVIQGSSNLVGGSSPGGSNRIAFNGGDGVGINGSASTGNIVFRNSIFSNAGLGIDLIDLGADGPTANDTGDADTGSNGLQNKPVLTSAKTLSGKTTIKGKLNSHPNVGYTVLFFSNPSGNEGKKFIGATEAVGTDSSGNDTFTFSPKNAVPVGQRITATAAGDRNAPDGTSEFSAPRKVAAS